MANRPVMYRGVVRSEHCDHMGHMNVMWYVGKFDEASWQLFAAMGLSRSRMQKENRAVAGVATDTYLEQFGFRQEAGRSADVSLSPRARSNGGGMSLSNWIRSREVVPTDSKPPHCKASI